MWIILQLLSMPQTLIYGLVHVVIEKKKPLQYILSYLCVFGNTCICPWDSNT